MRSRLIFVALVSLLFCSLSTLETSELLKLADDTSNDFSLCSPQQEISSAVGFSRPVARPRSSPARATSERAAIRRRFASSSRPTQDFLHFLCIQRT